METILEKDLYRFILARAPFKIGERVVLTKSPARRNAPGWIFAKHFLIKGSKAIVEDIKLNFADNSYSFYLKFDSDSDKVYSYCFYEGEFKSAKNKKTKN